MELSIEIEELRKRSFLVCTPMYGGMASGQFTKSSIDLGRIAQHYGIEHDFFFMFNESLITRARNYCVDEFLRGKWTHLMFIDADIGYDPNDVLALLAVAEPGSDKEVVCGPYPKKAVSWEKIKMAVDKGYADDDPNQLEKYVGDYVFNPTKEGTSIRLDEPVEVLESGTGFMMIQRSAFEKYADTYPEFAYRPDHVRSKNFDGSRKIHAYFDTVIDNAYVHTANKMNRILTDATSTEKQKLDKIKKLIKEVEKDEEFSERYLSEDYMFCQWARNAGIKVWLCPWMRLTHYGNYTFGGSLVDLAQIGAAATADQTTKAT